MDSPATPDTDASTDSLPPASPPPPPEIAKADPGMFGKLAIAHGMATPNQVVECLAVQKAHPTKPLGMIMVEMGYLRKDQLETLVAMLRSKPKESPTAARPKETNTSVDRTRQQMDKLLAKVAEMGASDLHLNVGSPPIVRLHGTLTALAFPQLNAEQTRALVVSLLDEPKKAHFFEQKDIDFCLAIEGGGRFRVNAFHQRNGIDASFRIIPQRIPTLEELGIPKVIERLIQYQQGLVLITGPAGCGKTTTLAALVELINGSRKQNIICLEQPIEYIIPSRGCNVVQREIPRDSLTFPNALRAALRENPDVVILGEMRDLDTISTAITAAETGHLVLGSLHTSSAARTVDRILNVFPPKEAAQVRAMVSESLRGIVSQTLVPNVEGNGRVAACEVLFNSPAIANLIRDERTFQIPGVMQTQRKAGMQLLDDALLDLVRQQRILPAEAWSRAENKAPFAKLM